MKVQPGYNKGGLDLGGIDCNMPTKVARGDRLLEEIEPVEYTNRKIPENCPFYDSNYDPNKVVGCLACRHSLLYIKGNMKKPVSVERLKDVLELLADARETLSLTKEQWLERELERWEIQKTMAHQIIDEHGYVDPPKKRPRKK